MGVAATAALLDHTLTNIDEAGGGGDSDLSQCCTYSHVMQDKALSFLYYYSFPGKNCCGMGILFN